MCNGNDCTLACTMNSDARACNQIALVANYHKVCQSQSNLELIEAEVDSNPDRTLMQALAGEIQPPRPPSKNLKNWLYGVNVQANVQSSRVMCTEYSSNVERVFNKREQRADSIQQIGLRRALLSLHTYF